MTELGEIAPAFVDLAHRIVWCTVSTTDPAGRPRSRVLHPLWEWDGQELTGWIVTSKTPIKQAHLAHSPYASCNYWAPTHDTCLAECAAEWVDDVATKTRLWELFKSTPAPLGYDPGAIGVPGWTGPESPNVSLLRLRPWRLRVLLGENLQNGFKATSWRA
ncbi:pyridoxamine 5'-phosphate oxidase family protein [Nocardia colli]|uniref:Pyridoxamine 5'-phosphate oxidase family protein n=1 Tax=Nocardia colli TaxID=2545717 RepID=A0A5N0DTC3_9NOCA|nr:pyridoxamine 5'-phosphate oxidase family protein [Nocardia colli]KAA8880337.1 pyridoxamine 5'-phosphate oxidase family protein [Nocardia colli]